MLTKVHLMWWAGEILQTAQEQLGFVRGEMDFPSVALAGFGGCVAVEADHDQVVFALDDDVDIARITLRDADSGRRHFDLHAAAPERLAVHRCQHSMINTRKASGPAFPCRI